MTPDELIDLAMQAMADPKIDLDRRISIAFQLADRAYQRPTTDVTVNTGATTTNYEHLDKMPLDERRAFLARLRGEAPRDADGHQVATTGHDDEKPEQPPPVAPTTDA